ncbi:MAG: hypothetical protein HY648_05760 [Acidobacteria bacterium]|nr:hypothetical protein [Acidobacteriota bacterium]
MRKFLLFALGCLLCASGAKAASDVELTDCRLTPEVKKELQLTAEQGPKVEKVFADLSSIRDQIAQSRAKRDELRKAGATAEAIDPVSKQIISGENQCRERLHQMLQPILTEAQFNKVSEMEEVHNKKVRERQTTSQEKPAAK